VRRGHRERRAHRAHRAFSINSLVNNAIRHGDSHRAFANPARAGRIRRRAMRHKTNKIVSLHLANIVGTSVSAPGLTAVTGVLIEIGSRFCVDQKHESVVS